MYGLRDTDGLDGFGGMELLLDGNDGVGEVVLWWDCSFGGGRWHGGDGFVGGMVVVT